MMMHPIVILARYTWIQAWRSRWPLLALATVVVALVCGVFFASLAITESTATFVAITAAAARIIGVCALSFFVIALVMRDRQERALESLLALPVSRGHYYLGRWLGMVLLAASQVLLLAPLIWSTTPAVAGNAWLVAYGCELIIVGSFSLLCAITLRQLPLALFATLGFYALARSVAALVAMASHPVLPDQGVASAAVLWLAQSIAAVLPDLSYAASASLVYDAEGYGVSAMLMQTLIYTAMLVGAGLVDMYRREIT